MDRNSTATATPSLSGKSSPARGTWIEIGGRRMHDSGAHVVPRKGDVDRNYSDGSYHGATDLSSPARGTWIEILWKRRKAAVLPVVPRKGDVDRNMSFPSSYLEKYCRPPQGGRG